MANIYFAYSFNDGVDIDSIPDPSIQDVIHIDLFQEKPIEFKENDIETIDISNNVILNIRIITVFIICFNLLDLNGGSKKCIVYKDFCILQTFQIFFQRYTHHG